MKIMPKYEILLVDDDLLILQTIGSTIETYGYNITTAENGESAIELLDKKHFDIVITDLVMDKHDGFQVLKKAKKIDPTIKVIILTAYGSTKYIVNALRLRADDFLIKPCGSQEILFRINKCLDHSELERKVKVYEKILPVCSMCKKIRDDTGKEPGTGKWMPMENYLFDKAKIEVSHSYCPECAKKVQEQIEDI